MTETDGLKSKKRRRCEEADVKRQRLADQESKREKASRRTREKTWTTGAGQTEVLTENRGETGVICTVRSTVRDAQGNLFACGCLDVSFESRGEKLRRERRKERDKRGVQINGGDTAEFRG